MSTLKLSGLNSGSSIIKAPDSGSTGVTFTLPASAGTLAKTTDITGGATGADFNDNTKLRFGTGNDLEIYHDGSNSVIHDVGTGNLLLKGDNLSLRNASNESYLTGVSNGEVSVYHDNSVKLQTSATGITVTNDITTAADGKLQSTSGYMQVIAEDTLYLKCDSDNAGGESITFQHGPDTVMTINENGRTDWGAFTTAGNAYGFQIQGSTQQHTLYQSQDGTGNFDFHRYYNGHGYIGRIRHSGGSLSFANLSDYRRKENVVSLTGSTAKVKQLNPIKYNLITDETNTATHGFLAHEVSPVCPEAVGGEKDAVDDDGNPEYQFLDSTKLIPLLVGTIKELEARITTLEG